MPRIGYAKKKLIEEHSKKLTDIFKEVETSKNIEEESEIITTKNRFDFRDSKSHSKTEIDEIKRVLNGLRPIQEDAWKLIQKYVVTDEKEV